MRIISNSFKRNKGLKFAKSLNVDDEKMVKNIVDAWIKGFEVSESMFVEQD